MPGRARSAATTPPSTCSATTWSPSTATALCTASFQATHRKPDDTLWTLGGIYRFTLVRTGDGWRITSVVMTTAWSDGSR